MQSLLFWLGWEVYREVVCYHRHLLRRDGRAHVDHALDDGFPVLAAEANGTGDRLKVVTAGANHLHHVPAIAIGKVLRERGRNDGRHGLRTRYDNYGCCRFV